MSYFKKSINSILGGNIKCFNDIKNLFERILNTLNSPYLKCLATKDFTKYT